MRVPSTCVPCVYVHNKMSCDIVICCYAYITYMCIHIYIYIHIMYIYNMIICVCMYVCMYTYICIYIVVYTFGLFRAIASLGPK